MHSQNCLQCPNSETYSEAKHHKCEIAIKTNLIQSQWWKSNETTNRPKEKLTKKNTKWIVLHGQNDIIAFNFEYYFSFRLIFAIFQHKHSHKQKKHEPSAIRWRNFSLLHVRKNRVYNFPNRWFSVDNVCCAALQQFSNENSTLMGLMSKWTERRV